MLQKLSSIIINYGFCINYKEKKLVKPFLVSNVKLSLYKANKYTEDSLLLASLLVTKSTVFLQLGKSEAKDYGI